MISAETITFCHTFGAILFFVGVVGLVVTFFETKPGDKFFWVGPALGMFTGAFIYLAPFLQNTFF